jgi:hypothetical protein
MIMITHASNRELSEIVEDSVRTGMMAAATTTAAAVICGQFEDHQPIGPINAVSHILWGDRAARRTGFSLKHTLTGAVLNAAAVTSWAFVQEVVFGRRHRRATLGEALVEGTVVSGLAYVMDYHVVPDRLTPGFEKRLSNKSLAAIYCALAVGLAAGALRRR